MSAEEIHAELEAAQVVNRDIFDGVRAIPGLMDTVAQSVDSKLSEMNVSPLDNDLCGCNAREWGWTALVFFVCGCACWAARTQVPRALAQQSSLH